MEISFNLPIKTSTSIVSWRGCTAEASRRVAPFLSPLSKRWLCNLMREEMLGPKSLHEKVLFGPDRLTKLPQDLLVKIVVLIQSGRELLALSQASKDFEGAPWGGRWHDENLLDAPNGGLDWKALIKCDWKALIKCDDNAECNSNKDVKVLLNLETHHSFLESVEKICEKRPSRITIEESPSSFAIKNDLPWARLISKETMETLFKCVTRVKIEKASPIHFLCFAIRSKSLPNLKELHLGTNNIGNAGMTALAGAISSGSLRSLQDLNLYKNKIGDAGMTEFSRAIASGSLGNLQQLSLGYNQISDVGMKAFAAASGSLRKLEYLGLGGNSIGDAGMTTLAGAIASGSLPALKQLSLTDNQIGYASMAAFVDVIASPLPNLLELHIELNKMDDAEMQAFADVVEKRLPNLKFFM